MDVVDWVDTVDAVDRKASSSVHSVRKVHPIRKTWTPGRPKPPALGCKRIAMMSKGFAGMWQPSPVAVLALMAVALSCPGWCGKPANGPVSLEKRLAEYGGNLPAPDCIRAIIRKRNRDSDSRHGSVRVLEAGRSAAERTVRATPHSENGLPQSPPLKGDSGGCGFSRISSDEHNIPPFKGGLMPPHRRVGGTLRFRRRFLPGVPVPRACRSGISRMQIRSSLYTGRQTYDMIIYGQTGGIVRKVYASQPCWNVGNGYARRRT